MKSKLVDFFAITMIDYANKILQWNNPVITSTANNRTTDPRKVFQSIDGRTLAMALRKHLETERIKNGTKI